MANMPDNFKINVPLNELFCIDNDDLPFGGSWNGNYLYYIEYNLFLCKNGINFNESDPRCNKLENLLKFSNTSWLFEFYYPVVQFQPTNFSVPLAVIYRSYFYRLAPHSNKVERIYISQHILNDDRSILYTNNKNTSIWGMNSLYGDDYYMNYDSDSNDKNVSSRLYSLDIYMDQEMIYYKRSYKKIFLIISDFFPVLKFIMSILKKFTQHFKTSSSKRKLAGLLFENVEINEKSRASKKLNKLSYISIRQQNKLKNETYYNNSLKELNNKKNETINNSTVKQISIRNKKPKKNIIIYEENNNNFPSKKSSDSDIKNSISFNKSNLSFNNENIIQMLNKKGITKMNSNKKSFILSRDSKFKDLYSTYKKKKINDVKRENKILFPYFYFFLDFFFDKFRSPQRFCCVSKSYFTMYNFMCQIYDISTHIMLFKQFIILNNIVFDNINNYNATFPFEKDNKMNINDQNLLDRIEAKLENTKFVMLSDIFLKK
jgi:hypothetical protein